MKQIRILSLHSRVRKGSVCEAAPPVRNDGICSTRILERHHKFENRRIKQSYSIRRQLGSPTYDVSETLKPPESLKTSRVGTIQEGEFGESQPPSNPTRGLTIRMPSYSLSANRSVSPVTANVARPSSAAADICHRPGRCWRRSSQRRQLPGSSARRTCPRTTVRDRRRDGGMCETSTPRLRC